ncbi:MAG TPA: hypothetical protein VHL31_00070 [Geminicoccus sp.]|jgi:hypothetical protein|uniref:hypothetical protein n=1 Tax=Geminicoccus sp. TaxID=2024832 RepID=UPI002E355A8A|nr:hypothetical protein [Geminicoccus sp.]HEX2524688.1 hypothetical protein [Geminicoccus sp.]
MEVPHEEVDEAETMLVTGELLLPADAPDAQAARVLVEVREIGPADAPSTVAGTLLIEDVAVGPGGRVHFAVEVPDVDARRHYGLRAHVDLDGDGRVGGGDLLSTVAQPVLTFGAPDHANLPLTLVAGGPNR